MPIQVFVNYCDQVSLRPRELSMSPAGVRDSQTVIAGGGRAAPAKIAGVEIHELGNVITRSGFMTEILRTDWSVIGITVHQINWVQLNPGAVTDWHAHA